MLMNVLISKILTMFRQSESTKTHVMFASYLKSFKPYLFKNIHILIRLTKIHFHVKKHWLVNCSQDNVHSCKPETDEILRRNNEFYKDKYRNCYNSFVFKDMR